MAGRCIDPLPLVNLVLCLSRQHMDWTGVEQTEVGWISCVLHLSKCSKGCLLWRFVHDYVCLRVDMYVYVVFVLYTRVGETKG